MGTSNSDVFPCWYKDEYRNEDNADVTNTNQTKYGTPTCCIQYNNLASCEHIRQNKYVILKRLHIS